MAHLDEARRAVQILHDRDFMGRRLNLTSAEADGPKATDFRESGKRGSAGEAEDPATADTPPCRTSRTGWRERIRKRRGLAGGSRSHGEGRAFSITPEGPAAFPGFASRPSRVATRRSFRDVPRAEPRELPCLRTLLGRVYWGASRRNPESPVSENDSSWGDEASPRTPGMSRTMASTTTTAAMAPFVRT